MVKKNLEDLETEVDNESATEVSDAENHSESKSEKKSESPAFVQKIKDAYVNLDNKIREKLNKYY